MKKKVLDTLQQQKKSFINFIKTKEKYSRYIADLFYDDEIERLDSMEWVRDYLEQKWISKEVSDSLIGDYKLYLKSKSYYWPMGDCSEELGQSIKENNRKLKEIKKEILKEYREYKDFISFDLKGLIDTEFHDFDKSKVSEIEDWNYLKRKIYVMSKDVKWLEEELQNIQKEIKKLRSQLEKAGWFQGKKKKELSEMLYDKGLERKEKEHKKAEIEKLIKDYEHKEIIAQNIDRIKRWDGNRVNSIMWSGNYCDIEQCKQAIRKIYNELRDFSDYIPDEIIAKIKTYIVDYIEKNREKEKNKFEWKIKDMCKEYLNYFYSWNNKFSGEVMTAYSKSRIDPKLMVIINELWVNWNKEMFEKDIDYDFMDDVFVHTTWFDILDDILEEWWLVSTNEIMKRSKYNQEISEARTQNHTHHKDVYFSRWFRKNSYWHAKSDDDFVFIANTMNNFAERGYWVPLSDMMQPNAWLDSDIEATHDIHWYSIISKSALEKDFWDNSYSKINVQDFYIFVPETKREEIESNPKYKTTGANIIYFPEKYKWKMSYELYEFIKREILKKNNENIKKGLIPRKIITSSDGIKSIGEWYEWAFCGVVWAAPEALFNPLKDWSDKEVISFLEKNQSDFWLSWFVNFQRLKNFLMEQKNNIEQIGLEFSYPKELGLLAVVCTKLQMYDWETKKYSLERIKNKLKEFGYTSRDLWILCKTIDWLCYLLRYTDNLRWNVWYRNSYVNGIRNRCEEWSVDFKQMNDFLVKIWSITLRSYQFDLLKDLLK